MKKISIKPHSQDDKVLSGFIFGILIGSVIALFRGPRFSLLNRLDQTRSRINESSKSIKNVLEDTIYSDPLVQGIEAGKEAARRRRSELGLEH